MKRGSQAVFSLPSLKNVLGGLRTPAPRTLAHWQSQHGPELLWGHSAGIIQVDLMVAPVGDQVVRRQEFIVQPGHGSGLGTGGTNVHDLHTLAFCKTL